MCGIAGWAAADPEARLDPALLRRMTRALAHRGPDGEGYFEEPGVALGHRRLSILDIERGAQPFFSPSGRYVVVYNGEIYNAPELRAALLRRGYPFHTHCDTEVITVSAEDRGFDFVNDLEGIFAFALWDRREKRLLLARDGAGVKPLIYRVDPDGLRFASEAKALYADPALGWTLDPQALSHYLSLNSIPAPFTIHKEARKLGHGETLVWRTGAARRAVFWRPPAAVKPESARGLAEDVRERTRESVRSQLQSDVPVGVFLSAGVDSAVVLKCAVEAGNPPPVAYCMGFEEASFDERPGARETAKITGAALEEFLLKPDLEAILPRMAIHFDEPFADSSAVPVWELCRRAARHVKVALSGEGGDEVFCGYETYRAHLLALRLRALGAHHVSGPLAALLARLPASEKKTTPLYKLQRFLPYLRARQADRHFLWKVISTEEAKRRLYTPEWRAAHTDLAPTALLWRRAFAAARGLEPVSRAMYADMQIYLPYDILVKVDMASMAHSLEVRVPLLDRRIIERVGPLPDACKLDLLHRKKPLRAAFENERTRPIFHRPKQGFSMPAARWLKRELRPMFFDAVRSSAFRDLGAVQVSEAGRLHRRHMERHEDLSRTLWGILMLALWAQGRPRG